MIRVFTQCTDRMASAEDQKTYDDLVTLSNAPSKIAGMKMEDIPGLEVLRKPGKYIFPSKLHFSFLFLLFFMLHTFCRG